MRLGSTANTDGMLHLYYLTLHLLENDFSGCNRKILVRFEKKEAAMVLPGVPCLRLSTVVPKDSMMEVMPG